MDDSGILFLRKSESDSLPHDVYGLTMVTDDYVEAAIRECVSPNASFKRFRKAFYENQDLYVVSVNPADAFSSIDIVSTPMCGIPAASRTDAGSVAVYGWAIDLNQGHSISNVDFHVGNDNVGTAELRTADDALLDPYPGTPKRAAVQFGLLAEINESLLSEGNLIYAEALSSSGQSCRGYLAPSRRMGLYPGRP